jgi:hypothetical protein
MQGAQEKWLPLTEYAIRTGISISTIRRKIKAEAIDYKMEDGRYLIRASQLPEDRHNGFVANDGSMPTTAASAPAAIAPAPVQAVAPVPRPTPGIVGDDLRWRALEARVAGLARKVEFMSEQMAEIKMLVKLFEEKVDEIR